MWISGKIHLNYHRKLKFDKLTHSVQLTLTVVEYKIHILEPCVEFDIVLVFGIFSSM